MAPPLLDFFMLFRPRPRDAEQDICCRLAIDKPIIYLPRSPLSAGEHGQLRRAKHAFIGGHAATFAASSECFIEPAPSLTFRANQLMHGGISRSAAAHHFGRRQAGLSPQRPALRLCTASYPVKKTPETRPENFFTIIYKLRPDLWIASLFLSRDEAYDGPRKCAKKKITRVLSARSETKTNNKK